jgi:hypothetical protein
MMPPHPDFERHALARGIETILPASLFQSPREERA